MSLEGVTFDCNLLDIDGETDYFGVSIPFTVNDVGGNVCGCAADWWECGVQSSNLQPPAPLEDL